jgi:PIN domain nuclease of toxin-antitoxin system
MGNARLGDRLAWLDRQPPSELSISVFSIWEIAKLQRLGRIQLPFEIDEWTHRALSESLIQVIPIATNIAIDANNLPGEFHRDPADQIIAATARALDCPLLTADAKILNYPHVRTVAL